MKTHLTYLFVIGLLSAFIIVDSDLLPSDHILKKAIASIEKKTVAYVEPGNELVKFCHIPLKESEAQIEWRQHSTKGIMSHVLVPFIKGTDRLIVQSTEIADEDDCLEKRLRPEGTEKVYLYGKDIPKGYNLPEEYGTSLLAIAPKEIVVHEAPISLPSLRY